jgi:hypothetical protein
VCSVLTLTASLTNYPNQTDQDDVLYAWHCHEYYTDANCTQYLTVSGDLGEYAFVNFTGVNPTGWNYNEYVITVSGSPYYNKNKRPAVKVVAWVIVGETEATLELAGAPNGEFVTQDAVQLYVVDPVEGATYYWGIYPPVFLHEDAYLEYNTSRKLLQIILTT